MAADPALFDDFVNELVVLGQRPAARTTPYCPPSYRLFARRRPIDGGVLRRYPAHYESDIHFQAFAAELSLLASVRAA